MVEYNYISFGKITLASVWPSLELDTVGKKTSELKDTEIEMFQNKTQTEKSLSMNCETISSSLTYTQLKL